MTLEDAKAYLRLQTTHEDALVERLVASARSLCEAFLGQLLVRRDVREDLPVCGAWQRLGASPVAAIVSVERLAGGEPQPLAVGAYAIDIDPAGDGWIRVAAGNGRVRVTYRAGMADDESGVPAGIAQGITRLAAHLYAHRDDSVGPPAAVAALWRPFRRLRLGLESRA